MLLEHALERACTKIIAALNEVHPADQHRVIARLLEDDGFHVLLERAENTKRHEAAKVSLRNSTPST